MFFHNLTIGFWLLNERLGVRRCELQIDLFGLFVLNMLIRVQLHIFADKVSLWHSDGLTSFGTGHARPGFTSGLTKYKPKLVGVFFRHGIILFVQLGGTVLLYRVIRVSHRLSPGQWKRVTLNPCTLGTTATISSRKYWLHYYWFFRQVQDPF